MNIAQRSFTGGELAPALYARTDLVKYATGLRTCRNFLVNRYGGVSNRPGTQFVGGTKASGVGRFIRFAFSNEQTYLIEFGDRYLRWFSAAARVIVSSATAWANATAYTVADLVSRSGVFYYCKRDHTSATATDAPGTGSAWEGTWSALTMSGTDGIYEIPTPYLAADLARLQTFQDGDTLTIVHPDYAPRQLKRYDHTRWILETLTFGPSIDQVQNVAATGGDSTGTANTYYAVTAVSEDFGDEGLPGLDTATDAVPTGALPIALSWDVTPGARTYRVYKSLDGQAYGFITEVGGIALPQSNTTWSDNNEFASTNVVGSDYVPAAGQARITVLSSASARAVDGKYTVKGTISVAATDGPSDVSGRVRVFYKRDSETRVDAGIIATDGFAGGTFDSLPFQAVITVPDNGYSTLVLDFVPEVAAQALAGLAIATCTVDFTSPPNDVVTWTAPQLTFSDTGFTPQFDIAPPQSPTLFTGPGLFPAAVGSFQQRRLYAGASLAPAQVRGSRTGVPRSFTTSTPRQDDDALLFALSTWTRTEIRHLRDLARLVVFASSGEWIVEGDNTNILKPNAINARQLSAFGASFLAPLQVGAATLFLQARQTIVRDLTIDTVQGASSSDLSVFAAHLFDGYTIVDWDYQQIPHGIVWAVRSDGVLLGLTYLPEQQVWGWHKHDTDGAVENVCVVPEGNEDAVYLLVRRMIDGATVRYVERMTPRAITALTDPRDLIFMDASLSYDGRNTGATTITISGGTNWDDGETLTLTASSALFAADMVGGAIVVFDADGAELFRVALETFGSATVMTGHPNKDVPAEYQGIATTSWGRAAITFEGLEHLEGCEVSVLGDGLVQASPNNDVYGAPLVVAGGSVTIPTPACVAHIGLPYLSDLETLDIDTAQGPSLKPFKVMINSFTCVVEASKPFFVGGAPPSNDDTDPLENLDEVMRRDVVNDFNPLEIRTGDFDATFSNRWNSHGRVFVRQPDPVPTTLLAVIPEGAMAPTN